MTALYDPSFRSVVFCRSTTTFSSVTSNNFSVSTLVVSAMPRALTERIDRVSLDEVNAYLRRREPGRMTIQTVGPEALRAPDATWHGFAQRSRVIVHSRARIEDPPNSLGQLTEERWRGRIGIARPQFGTTRGHVGALLHLWGQKNYQSWLLGLEYRRVRLYDGNASVVRAIAQGEIDVGLTDTDDVWAGQRNGWAVDLVYEADDLEAGQGGLPSPGAMVVPNTLALVAGGPNPDQGRALIDFLLSPRVESMIAASDSGNVPVIPGAAAAPGREIENPWRPDLRAVAAEVDRAVRLFEQQID